MICAFTILMLCQTSLKIFGAAGVVASVGTFQDVHPTFHGCILLLQTVVSAPLNHRNVTLCCLRLRSVSASVLAECWLSGVEGSPSLPPNLRNAIPDLLLKNGNQFLIGIHQRLLFFDLGDDLALGFEIRYRNWN